jgi:hypothetical protein
LFFTLNAGAFGGSQSMKSLYTLDRRKISYIEGEEFPEKRRIMQIFAVPEKGAVGTNALNNAITLLKFDDEKRTIKYDTVRKNFKKYVYGGDMFFLPEFSKDTIGYSQTRGFLLFNIKNKTFMDFTIGKVLGIVVEEVLPIDAEKKYFLFSLSYLLGMDKEIKVLKLLDLTTEEPKEIGSFDIEKSPLWARLGQTTFFFTQENEKRKLHALNEFLKPIDHPLDTVYNDDSAEFGEFSLPYVHPNLPFAILLEDNPKYSKNYLVWVATWQNTNEAPKMFKILGDNLSTGFQFSPDGRWVLFKDTTIDPRTYMIMPVDSNLPHFLGEPIMLKSDDEMDIEMNGKCAWISDPLSVVATRPDKLIKWQISPSTIHYKIAK